MRRRLPAARRRSELLDAAAELLADGGADAVTMEAVTAHAGVSKALGYRYFDNVETLLLTLAEREMGLIAEHVNAAMARATTFEASVRASLGAWFDVLAERGALVVALLESPALAGPLGERRRMLRGVIGDFYAERAAAAYGISPRVAGVATAVLLAGLDGLIDCWVERRVPRRELIDSYTTICLAAYQALADDPPVIGEPV